MISVTYLSELQARAARLETQRGCACKHCACKHCACKNCAC